MKREETVVSELVRVVQPSMTANGGAEHPIARLRCVQRCIVLCVQLCGCRAQRCAQSLRMCASMCACPPVTLWCQAAGEGIRERCVIVCGSDSSCMSGA